MRVTSHHETTFNQVQFAAKCNRLLADLKNIPHDSIAVCGKSGYAYAFGMLALGYPGKIISIRKPGEESRVGEIVEGYSDGNNRIIILDDLISSGKTINYMLEQLDREGLRQNVVAVVLHEEAITNGYRLMRGYWGGSNLKGFPVFTYNRQN